MATRRPGTGNFDMMPPTAADAAPPGPSPVAPTSTTPAVPPPPPALPRRPGTGAMALGPVAVTPEAPARRREGSAAIDLDAIMREHGVEPEEPTAISTMPVRRRDDDSDGDDGEPAEPTAITTTPIHHRPGSGAMALDELMRQSGVDLPRTRTPIQHRPGSGAMALDELMRQSGVDLPRTATPIQHRPGSGAMALDELMRQSGVERPLPASAADPFEAAATIVVAAPEPGAAAWDEAAPTEILTLPPTDKPSR